MLRWRAARAVPVSTPPEPVIGHHGLQPGWPVQRAAGRHEVRASTISVRSSSPCVSIVVLQMHHYRPMKVHLSGYLLCLWQTVRCSGQARFVNQLNGYVRM
jgi:hypothetical protein